jgi:hypothetical protein
VTGSFWSSIPDPVLAWGPGFIVLIGVFVLALYGGRGFVRLFGPALKSFINAQEKQADAMDRQAESMTKLAICIEAQAGKNAFQNERVMVSIQCLHDDNAAFRKELIELIREVRMQRKTEVSDGA